MAPGRATICADILRVVVVCSLPCLSKRTSGLLLTNQADQGWEETHTPRQVISAAMGKTSSFYQTPHTNRQGLTIAQLPAGWHHRAPAQHVEEAAHPGSHAAAGVSSLWPAGQHSKRSLPAPDQSCEHGCHGCCLQLSTDRRPCVLSRRFVCGWEGSTTRQQRHSLCSCNFPQRITERDMDLTTAGTVPGKLHNPQTATFWDINQEKRCHTLSVCTHFIFLLLQLASGLTVLGRRGTMVAMSVRRLFISE